MIKLVVALGNPGTQYEFTPHNIGWLAMDQLSFYEDLRWKEKFKGVYGEKSINGEKVYFLKPMTFMNLSGESVQPLCRFFKINLNEILVVHDELDLPYGQIMFKNGGGLAGHNGLKSIAQTMGGQDFMRLRLGVKMQSKGGADWLLSNFSKDAQAVLGDYLTGAAKAIEYSLKQGYHKAASQFSKKFYIPKVEDGS